jgi:hypothetical protein
VKLLLRRKNEFKLKVAVSGFDFPGPQSQDIRVELYYGDDRRATIGNWKKRGAGRFRREPGR